MTAAFFDKPSIVFTDTLFSKLPSVTRIENITELPKIIRTKLNKKIDLNELNSFIDFLEENSVDFDIFGLNALIGNTFYHGGHLKDTKISESSMSEFLKKHQLIFQKIIPEYLKTLNNN